MIINIITLFPKMFEGFISESIIKRAIGLNLVEINLIDLRTFSEDKHHRVDDTTYGGGAGLVLRPQPIFSALDSIASPTFKIMTTPQGKIFDQKMAYQLTQHDNITILCGHYEGYDERIRSQFDLELSVGDYVLTGGELPAMIISDAIIRLIEGVINKESHLDDSFSYGLLEYPQYTKPQIFMGMEVPAVLVNGNHREIALWRKKEALRKTYLNRPDLLDKYLKTDEEEKILKEIVSNENKKNSK